VSLERRNLDKKSPIRRSSRRHEEQLTSRRRLHLAGTPDPFLSTAPPELSHDPLGALTRLLDEAHAVLTPSDLAQLLMGVLSVIEPLRRGRSPARPASGPLPLSGRLSPAERVYMRSFNVALYLAARTLMADTSPSLRSLHRDLTAYVEEVVARPKGAAVL
jgi:hypothetical protein